MGKKKATALKADTKQLLDEHLSSASSTAAAGAPSAQLFSIDTKPSAPATKQQQLKRKRADTLTAEAAETGGAKKKKLTAGAAAKAAAASAKADDSDAMDTSDAAGVVGEAAYFHDSDDEQVGHVTRDRRQRTAHKPHATKLVQTKELTRLQKAAETKAAKEAAAAAAKTPLFDLWATTLEEDLKKGIVPATDAKGFRCARTQQSRFRHRGATAEAAKAHIAPSVLPKGIKAGASFHPDHGEHQKLLLEAYEKDEAEREEQRKIHARFHPRTAEGTLVANEAEKKEPEDDSWMDDGGAEPIKGPSTSSKKYSQTERNRMARAADNRAKHEAEKEEKALGKFVNRIPVLVAQWKKEEKVRTREKARVDELKETQPDRKPKLGPHVEAELFPEVALTEELPEGGALRAIKPSRHVLEEQFSRFQQRHLIETRKRVKPTKGYKARLYERFKEDPPATAPTAGGAAK